MARGGPRRLIGRLGAGMRRVVSRDPQEQQKRERMRQLRPQLRSRRSSSPDVMVATDAPHPLWRHLPADRQMLRDRWRLRSRRLLAWLKRKHQRIGITIILYGLLCCLPLFWGLPLVAMVALLPLLLAPPLAVLVYLLVRQEFHG